MYRPPVHALIRKNEDNSWERISLVKFFSGGNGAISPKTVVNDVVFVIEDAG